MGITYVEGRVRGPAGDAANVRFLVDSGATYSLLPHSTWTEIGLEPKRELEFTLADGTRVRRDVSECHVQLAEGEGHTPVILGELGDFDALLGVVTLQIVGLVFNPFSRFAAPDADDVGIDGAGTARVYSARSASVTRSRDALAAGRSAPSIATAAMMGTSSDMLAADGNAHGTAPIPAASPMNFTS